MNNSLDEQELDERFRLAIQMRDDGNLVGARDALLDLSKYDSTSAALFAVLGQVYWYLEELPRAIEAFRKATELAPRSEVASKGVFHCCWDMDDMDGAIAEIKRFLSIADSVSYREIVQEMYDKWVKEPELGGENRDND